LSDLSRRASRLKIRDLQAFMAVVKTSNMARAAIEIDVSQSVISKAIASLEEIVGVPLFSRHAHGVELTDRGRALVGHSAIIFANLNAALDDTDDDDDLESGVVRIGASASLVASLVAPAIVSFSKIHPKTRFVVRDGTANDLPGMVIDRLLEMCICVKSEAALHSSLDTLDLVDSPVSIYAGDTHPLAVDSVVSLLDLLEARWCLPPANHPLTFALNEMFLANDLPPPTPSIESSNPYVQSAALGSGDYLMPLTSGSNLLRDSLKKLTVAGASTAMRMRVSALITLKGRPLTLAAQKFSEHLIAGADALRETLAFDDYRAL
jgi:DNA-binding transcriptional LysR family regulator